VYILGKKSKDFEE